MTEPSIQPAAPLPGLELRLVDTGTSPPTVRGRIGCPAVLVVGRIPTAHVVLPANDRQASRLHFHIDLAPDYCRLTNQSDQGTFVNGLLVQAQCDLRHGDLIRAGVSVFVVQLLRGGEPADLAMSPTVLWEPLLATTAPDEEVPPTVPPALPPAPIQVPGYRLIRLLGSGGMGNVWLAEDHTGQPVALKLVRPELALQPGVCARFRREANHLRDLSHRHIVRFREAGEAQGLLYLVMDYVPGSCLATLLSQQGPLDVGRAVRFTCQVLDALKEAHNNGVVHRDVKPGNVLVYAGPHGEECRLADFGMAKVYQSASKGQTVTLTGVMGGTLGFAAPEMLTDFRQAGPLADQYGAAATLYNLLSARPLHDTNNAVQLIESIRTRDAVPLERRRAGLPEEVRTAVHRALQRDPRRRFPTVQAFRDALLPYVDPAGV